MLRFEFVPKVNYAGWLIWSSNHGYREYHLPDAGLPLAFGVEASNSRVVVLGNSGNVPETYRLTYSRQAGNTVGGKDDLLANVIVSRYDPARAAVRVDELPHLLDALAKMAQRLGRARQQQRKLTAAYY